MSDTTITETIYIAKDRDGNCRYVGRTRLPLARRRQLHSEQLRTDWLACPLYRFMHQEGATFDEDDWSIEPLATVAFPDTPNLGATIEHEAIEFFRRTYEPHLILNTNRPMCSSARAARRRQQQKAWRDAHLGYMAQKAKEHRARRKRKIEESDHSQSD